MTTSLLESILTQDYTTAAEVLRCNKTDFEEAQICLFLKSVDEVFKKYPHITKIKLSCIVRSEDYTDFGSTEPGAYFDYEAKDEKHKIKYRLTAPNDKYMWFATPLEELMYFIKLFKINIKSIKHAPYKMVDFYSDTSTLQYSCNLSKKRVNQVLNILKANPLYEKTLGAMTDLDTVFSECFLSENSTFIYALRNRDLSNDFGLNLSNILGPQRAKEILSIKEAQDLKNSVPTVSDSDPKSKSKIKI